MGLASEEAQPLGMAFDVLALQLLLQFWRTFSKQPQTSSFLIACAKCTTIKDNLTLVGALIELINEIGN